MSGRIIRTAEGWAQWGTIVEDTTIVDDYQTGWGALTGEILTVQNAITRAYPQETP